MRDDLGETYPLAYGAVREKAPRASGVYTVFTPRRWVYVGETDDIRRSLFRHLNDAAAPMERFGPLSFSFQTVPPTDRVARQASLVADLRPACQGQGG